MPPENEALLAQVQVDLDLDLTRWRAPPVNTGHRLESCLRRLLADTLHEECLGRAVSRQPGRTRAQPDFDRLVEGQSSAGTLAEVNGDGHDVVPTRGHVRSRVNEDALSRVVALTTGSSCASSRSTPPAPTSPSHPPKLSSISRDMCPACLGTQHSGARGTRTPDLLGAIQALSQLSYSP
jgi:hypothetical protein